MIALLIRTYRFTPPPLPTAEEFAAVQSKANDARFAVGSDPGNMKAEAILLTIFTGSFVAGLVLHGGPHQVLSAILGFFGGIMALASLLSLISSSTAQRQYRAYNQLFRKQIISASDHDAFVAGFQPIHDNYLRSGRI